jgi:hypothetical protein
MLKMLVAMPLQKALNSFFVRIRGAVGFLTLIALLLSGSSVQAERHIGYIIDIEGRWQLGVNPAQELSRGSQVPAGGVIRIESPTPYDYIVISNFSGDIIARRQCSNPGDCNRPLRLPRPVESHNSIFGAIIGSVMSLFGGEPDRYSVHGQRGDELSEGVVLIKDGQVALDPVFAGRGSERFYLRLRAVAPRGRPLTEPWIGPITFNWEPGKSSTASFEGIKPGLYELALLERSGNEYIPTGSTAWILASRPKQYRRLSLSFQKAVSLTQKWGKAITPEAARSFLRADLDYLARTARKRKFGNG